MPSTLRILPLIAGVLILAGSFVSAEATHTSPIPGAAAAAVAVAAGNAAQPQQSEEPGERPVRAAAPAAPYRLCVRHFPTREEAVAVARDLQVFGPTWVDSREGEGFAVLMGQYANKQDASAALAHLVHNEGLMLQGIEYVEPAVAVRVLLGRAVPPQQAEALIEQVVAEGFMPPAYRVNEGGTMDLYWTVDTAAEGEGLTAMLSDAGFRTRLVREASDAPPSLALLDTTTALAEQTAALP